MTSESLQDALQRVGSATRLLRDLPGRHHTLPIQSEHTNWQSEQRAWRETCALMDQSHHMTDLFLQGPDALSLLGDLGVNSFASFSPGRAKQLVVCSPDGFYIGDVILMHLPNGTFNLVGREIVMDWVQYHLETGDYRATAERDDNSAVRSSGPPRQYRYEIQGPHALALVEDLLGHEVPTVKFFHMTDFTIAGHAVLALRHGMAGQAGFELFGPWGEGEAVKEAILARGGAYGLRQVGAKAYSTANLESGWIPPTLPGIFSGEPTQGFRAWLGTENLGALGGSLYFENVEDYYLTPYDLGYGSLVSFDHDFLGRSALEKVAENPPRRKVSLVWNASDVARAFESQVSPGQRAKLINLPKARYALYQKDEVRKDGELVGVSMDCGLIANEQVMISLASLDAAHAAVGTEVVVIWGEDPPSSKPQVEPHAQVEIRATVAPAPYTEFARGAYRDR